MRAARAWRRPFLGLRRTDTEAVCTALGLPWWDDPTNAVGGAGEPPLRSRVRAAVVPALVDVLGPGAVPGLARTADLLRDDADLLDALAAELLDRAVVAGGQDDPASPGVVELDVGTLAAAHPALRRRALRAAALRAGCPDGDLFAVHVAALDALVARWRGQGPVHLPGDRRASRSCGRLSLGPPDPPPGPSRRPPRPAPAPQE
ncbi:TilS substrate-binding domain-containing protein [Cellulosimicrobium sp. CUA-896]|uniref:TilS substrate-binding domain-containing protein n=1 Tax=Cellulosimicrobium sp. CUA-896 TaxID=1517881 RepID=UPI0009625D27|nr:TilS substrate-binding domain-containing protein [Cellulosimicrobium sp. CUA-896]OLT47129.1 hypothetical protein BJF88_17275 [Cellulosimicrobium sp. CUA-896]